MIGRELAMAEAKRAGIPEDLFLRLINQESGWNPNAVSPRGAFGLTQAMPATWENPGFGVTPGGNRSDPKEQLRFGADYTKAMLDYFGGDPVKAAAAYNWGAGNVDNWDGDLSKLPEETRNYVQRVALADGAPGGGTIADYAGPQTIADQSMYRNQPVTGNAVMDEMEGEKEKGTTVHLGLGLQSLGQVLSNAAVGQNPSAGLGDIRKAYYAEREAEAERRNKEMQRNALIALVGKDSAFGQALMNGADPQAIMAARADELAMQNQAALQNDSQSYDAGQREIDRNLRREENAAENRRWGIQTMIGVDQFNTTEDRLSEGQDANIRQGDESLGIQEAELGMRRAEQERQRGNMAGAGKALKESLIKRAEAIGDTQLAETVRNMPDEAAGDVGVYDRLSSLVTAPASELSGAGKEFRDYTNIYNTQGPAAAAEFRDKFVNNPKSVVSVNTNKTPEQVAAEADARRMAAYADEGAKADVKQLADLNGKVDQNASLMSAVSQYEQVLAQNPTADSGSLYQYANPIVEGLRVAGIMSEDDMKDWNTRASLQKLSFYMSKFMRQAGEGSSSDWDAQVNLQSAPTPQDTPEVAARRIEQFKQTLGRESAMTDYLNQRVGQRDENGEIITLGKARKEWKDKANRGDADTLPGVLDFDKFTPDNLKRLGPPKVGSTVALDGKLIYLADPEAVADLLEVAPELRQIYGLP